MAMEQHYPIYDTAIFVNAAAVHTLFTQPEGASATKQSEDTNMRIGGQFATNQKFRIDKISIYPDGIQAQADINNLWKEAWIEVIQNNDTLLQIPMRQCADFSNWKGEFHEATNTALAILGLHNGGFGLKVPIVITGGNQFKVVLNQVTALSVATFPIKCVLDGILTTLDSR